MKLEHSLTLYTKVISKWIKDLNVRPDTIKSLEEKRILFDINRSNNFLNTSPRVMENKNKWDLNKFKSFYTAKKIINETKNNLWDGRKYLQVL